MTLRELVTIAVRPRRAWPNAMLLSVAALTVGCSHNRQSYRPIYSTRSAVTAPCTTCGSASTMTDAGVDVRRRSRSGVPLSDSVDDRFDRSRAASIGSSANGSSPRSSVESTPKASIGGQPDEFDDLSPTTDQRGTYQPLLRPISPTSPNRHLLSKRPLHLSRRRPRPGTRMLRLERKSPHRPQNWFAAPA